MLSLLTRVYIISCYFIFSKHLKTFITIHMFNKLSSHFSKAFDIVQRTKEQQVKTSDFRPDKPVVRPES